MCALGGGNLSISYIRSYTNGCQGSLWRWQIQRLAQSRRHLPFNGQGQQLHRRQGYVCGWQEQRHQSQGRPQGLRSHEGLLMDDWRELRSVYERAQLEHEMALWTQIVRREKPLWRRVLASIFPLHIQSKYNAFR